MALSLTIDGVVKRPQRGWSVSLTANGTGTFRGKFASSDGTYRPALDAEVILLDGATALFGGYITAAKEMSFSADDVGIVTDVTATDYNMLTGLRWFTANYPAGTLLKTVLTDLVPYLPGVTLHASQVDGPAMPELEFADVKISDVLDELTIHSGGYVWEVDRNKKLHMYLPGSQPAPFNVVSGASCVAEKGVSIEPKRKGYANYVVARNASYRKTASDAGAIAADGKVWETLVTVEDNVSEDGVQSIADMVLARALVVRKEAKYPTRSSGAFPGMHQTINLTERSVNNTYLITDVTIRDAGDQDGSLSYEISAIEGTTYSDGWQETYKRWGGGEVTVGGASGGGTVLQRNTYFLGGNGVEATRCPTTATWMPASGGLGSGQGAIQVPLNTVARGTRNATVTVRLRCLAGGVNVQARLYDVTTPASVGTSAVTAVTDSWITVSFAVELTVGTNYYELQLLTDVADIDICGVGILE